VIGEAFIDLIVPAWSINRGETYHREIRVFIGGLANVAIEISKMGEKANFVGKVGNDPFGMFLRQTLKQYGVKDIVFVDHVLSTGMCISLVYDGERTMIADRGANDNLSIEEIESCIDEIRNSKIAYFSGYSLQRGETRESVLKCIKDCHEHGVEVYFNPGAPNLIKKDFRQIIRNFVDVLILNEDEAKKLTRKKEDINFESLNELVDLAVVTRGKYGCTLIKNGRVVNVKTKEIKVQNTTGAGDAFSAGFIVGRLRGLNEVECAKLGNQTAARFLEERAEVFK